MSPIPPVDNPASSQENQYIMEISVLEAASNEIKRLEDENMKLRLRLSMFDDMMFLARSQPPGYGIYSSGTPSVLNMISHTVNDLKNR